MKFLPENKNFRSLLLRRFRKCFPLLVLDLGSVGVAYLMGLWLRFDCQASLIPSEYGQVYKASIVYAALLAVLVYSMAHLYQRVWRFASFRELELCFLSVVAFIVAHTLLLPRLFGPMPLSYFVFGGVFQLIALLGTRFGYRFLCLVLDRYSNHRNAENKCNAMVIGGGIAAQMIIRELNTSPRSDSVVRCVIDDDPSKIGCIIEDVKIVGNRDSILEAADRFHIQKIYFAIPSLSAQERRDILNICKETKAKILTLPGIYQLASGEVTVAQMREVSIADLLGRPPIQVDNNQILESLRGKVVRVTGGGGSIGSELCRQIANHAPRQLIIFDIYENNAYDIQQELRRRHGSELNLTVLIGSVRDTRRINQVFRLYHPEVVFHAAAHKHVPLMEDSPCEAVKNNVLGTYKTACAAIANGTRRFVLISTDKAVNPTNIMGASKRLCEMVVQTMDQLGAEGRLSELPDLQKHLLMRNTGLQEGRSSPGTSASEAGPSPVASHSVGQQSVSQTPSTSTGPSGDSLSQMPGGISSPLPPGQRTEFVAVRFGNVLGSNGSVVPLFKRQIAEGGPVTVTSPDIIRYFMTIPEAVSLVLQAETYARGGEVFVFDMGDPIKIDTLARNLIKLSGHTPDVDIRILYTGLRPGEKLYEERLMDTEGLRQTPNKLISIASPVIPDPREFLSRLLDIAAAAYTNADQMKQLVSQIVPTYLLKNPPH